MALTIPDFIARVRLYLRDLEPFNALIQGRETSDTLIALCMDLAIDDFNSSPPLIGPFRFGSVPFYLLLQGTVVEILKSAGMLQTRNQLTYSDGGISVSISDKTPLYMGWVNTFTQTYERKKAEYKRSVNLEQAYGGVSSEYTYANAVGSYSASTSMDFFTQLRLGFFVQ